MSKSYHRHAKKFDDDFEEEQIETKDMKKIDRFTRQMKKLKLSEDRDHDT
jgi:hypothetical protein